MAPRARSRPLAPNRLQRRLTDLLLIVVCFPLGGAVAGAVCVWSVLLAEALFELSRPIQFEDVPWLILGPPLLGGPVGALCALVLMPIAALILLGTDVPRGILRASLAGSGAAALSPIWTLLPGDLLAVVLPVALAVLVALFCHSMATAQDRCGSSPPRCSKSG